MIASGHERARVGQVLDVPLVRILAADAGEIRPGALGAPLERMVVHALGGEAVVAVALDLVAQRADHLAVAAVAALADVDVAPGQLERRVGPHALHLLDRALDARTAARSAPGRRWTTTIRMPISRMSEFFSKTSCFIGAPSIPPRTRAQRRARRRCAAARRRRPARRRARCARRCRP